MTDALQDLITEYQNARAEFENAQRTTSMARNHETEALNRMNAAQKKIDETVAELRKGAPRESGWKRDDKVFRTAMVLAK